MARSYINVKNDPLYRISIIYNIKYIYAYSVGDYISITALNSSKTIILRCKINMKKLLILSLILSMFTLMGCARHAKIIVDPEGVDMGHYRADLAECRQLAEQVEEKAGAGLVGGAIVGGLVGEIIGGRDSTRIGASLGALKGGLRGGAASNRERARVVKNCLRNRGYRVLN